MPRRLSKQTWLLWVLLVWAAALTVGGSEPAEKASPAPEDLPAEKTLPARAPTQEPPPASKPSKILVPKTLDDLRAIEAEFKRVITRVLPAVVAVRIGSTQGSGVVVSPDGYVLTAGHVAGNPGQEVVFTFPDGKTAKGKTLGIHRRADAGLLKIAEAGPWPNVEMGKSDGVKEGDWCVAAGHPLGYQEDRPPVVRVGRVLRAEGPLVQTDCPLVAGDSGGPLFDLEGKVIAVNSRIAGPATMNFHVPIDTFHEVWTRLVQGEAWDEPIPGKDSAEVKSAFREAIARGAACVVRVKCDGKDAALGTIVGPDGWILTKASELDGRITCRLGDGRELAARIVGVNEAFDLAMLKLDVAGLPVIPWGSQEPAVGDWVAAPGPEDDRPLAVGVLSVPRRAIPAASGVLGVSLGDAEEGGRVLRIIPDSAAEQAGLKLDDVITHVNGLPTPNQSEVVAAIKRYRPGEVVKLRVKRGEEVLEITATLTKLQTPSARKRDLQNRSAVGISARSDDFPVVLQHDTVLRPSDCGGPLVDLDGSVIGVNIARAGRTETYAVPTDVLLGLMYDLMSGRLAPPKPEESPAPGASPSFHDQMEGEPGEAPPAPAPAG